jgi:hopanoid biosynthesis associated RND transporter like protein HpnN
MRTLSDLMDDPVTSPYTMDLLAPDIATARRYAGQLEKLPQVDSVLWLDDFVPKDQAAKLPLIADAATLLDPTLAAPTQLPPVSAARLRAAVGAAGARLTAVVPKLPADSPLVQIAGELNRLQGAPDDMLLAANSAITRFLPMQLDRLRLALAAVPVTEADIPPEIRRDWVAPDGRPRVQIVPKVGIRGSDALEDFVTEVQAVAPDAAGSAVTIVRSAETVVTAFRTAALSALVAITVILAAVLRRALDVAMVLAPLLLSSLLTVLAAVLLPLPLNFANIIALPLLLGVGVSFNIYFVMNWRAGRTRPLGTATARAVVFSALTTGTAFGSLALSHHPGTASMGQLLLLSLACTVLTTMLFLPALLASVTAATRTP